MVMDAVVSELSVVLLLMETQPFFAGERAGQGRRETSRLPEDHSFTQQPTEILGGFRRIPPWNGVRWRHLSRLLGRW